MKTSRGSRFAVMAAAALVVLMVASTAVTFAVVAKGPKVRWTQTVLDDTQHFYVCDIAVGSEYLYALGWIYPWDQSLLFRSPDLGRTWLEPITVTAGAYPGMCVYDDGGSDVLLMVGGYAQVMKSVDNGLTWSYMTPLPGTQWSTLAIGTNASWLGGAPDSDIYVVGCVGNGAFAYQTSMTVSHDAGLTWDSLTTVAPTNYQNGWCEVLGDGSSLYVAYTLFGGDPNYGAMCARSSSDWGATWTPEKIVARTHFVGPNILLKPMSMQYTGDGQAFITLADCTDVGQVDLREGRWGYLSLSDLTYTETGNVSWACGDFAGKILPNGKLAVVFETYTDGTVFPLMFAVTKHRIV